MENNWLKINVDEKYFKSNEYVYQELFASDIPYYHKKLESGHHIWCNMACKEVHVNDWYGSLTSIILNYYIQNKKSDKVITSKMFDDYQFIAIRLNRKTGEIKTKSEIFKECGDIDTYFNSVYVTEWDEICLVIKSMDLLIEEMNKITNNEFVLNN